MPWRVKRVGVRWCVQKIADGSTAGCHDSEEQAQAQLRALYASEANAALDALTEFAREGDVNVPGVSHNLRDYWTRGEGAAKIRWGTEGDGTRCIKHLRKYVRDPGGLCQEYHRRATGKSMHPHPGRLTEAGEMEEFADTPAEPYGDVKYADPGYRGRKRYPIDTTKHIRAAWAYINMPKNAAKYSAEQLKAIKAKIKKAMTGLGAEVAADGELITAAKMKGCPPGHHKMPDGSCMSDDDMRSYAAEVDGPEVEHEPWEGDLVVEDTESGDGRMFSTGSLDWAQLPLPLMYQPANTKGHDGSILVGEITHMRRQENRIRGRGHIFAHVLAGEHGDDVRQMVRTGGVSVDVDSVKDADVETIYASDDKEGFFSKPETTIFHRGRIRGGTLVAFPAFVEAKLHFVNEEELTASADCGCPAEPLVAAAHTITIPDLPRAEWFDEPKDVELSGALTITDEGRVYGILAPGNTTHRNRPTTVPLRGVDYSRFHKGETIVEGGGRVVTGVITADCGHAPTDNYGSLQARMDHYDNSCSVLANVRVGESERGYVWVAGALNQGAQPTQVAQALGCALSGDWQPHPDRPGVREFIAAHLVPVPGFPLARTKASVITEEGVVTASWVPVRHEPTRELAAVNAAKLEIAQRFGLDPASRKAKAYAKMKRGKATCALADVSVLT